MSEPLRKRPDDKRKPPHSETQALLAALDQNSRGYLRRLRDTCVGLKAPKDSLEYKQALQDVPRLFSPLVALVLLVAVVVLMSALSLVQRDITQEKPVEVTLVEKTDIPEVEPVIEPLIEEVTTLDDPDMADLSDVIAPEIAGEKTPNPEPSPLSALPNSSTFVMPGISVRKGGGGGGLGGKSGKPGDLKGTFVNLSCDAKGRARKSDFYADIRGMLQKGLKKEAFASFASVHESVFMSYLVLPYAKSSLGPTTFETERSIRRGAPWVIVYRGRLQPAVEGTYRFVGVYDDVMVVRVNGKTVFEFASDTANVRVGTQTALKTGWSPKDPAVTGKYRASAFRNMPLTFGDWFTVQAGKPASIEILIADKGGTAVDDGGFTGGILLVEEEGRTYETTPDGMPLLPPFATSHLSYNERQRLVRARDVENRSTSLCAFTLTDVPEMSAKKTAKKEDDFITSTHRTIREVTVDVGDL